MQSYVILKQPGKAVFYLFTIMILLVVRDAYGAGLYSTRAGPIKIVKCFHEFSGGNLHVSGNRVETSDTGGDLYQISVGQNFTLYDPRARKFICWNKRRIFLEARNYSKDLKIDDCLFSDIPSPEPYHSTHVNLVHRNSRNQTLELKFNKGGTFIKRKCKSPKNKLRHRHKCIRQANFLLSMVKPYIPCPRAEDFCTTKLSKMPQLRECCKHFIWSNETTD